MPKAVQTVLGQVGLTSKRIRNERVPSLEGTRFRHCIGRFFEFDFDNVESGETKFLARFLPLFIWGEMK